MYLELLVIYTYIVHVSCAKSGNESSFYTDLILYTCMYLYTCTYVPSQFSRLGIQVSLAIYVCLSGIWLGGLFYLSFLSYFFELVCYAHVFPCMCRLDRGSNKAVQLCTYTFSYCN